MHGTLRGQQPIVLGVRKGVFAEPHRYGRMFPQLRSLKEHQLGISPEALGRPGGPMDGGTSGGEDNSRIPGGFTFLGQFLDHDITFDPTSSLESQNDPHATRNFRTPAFELDSVYGSGPQTQPYLYDGKRFLLSENSVDVPRNRNGTAIIGEPRNDEHLIIAQLQQAFMRFHNVVLEHFAGDDFEEAQRLVRWHYQWIILHEYLPLTCGESIVEDVLHHGPLYFNLREQGFRGRGWRREPFMPVEFSVAAFRFGHSQVQATYRINQDFEAVLFPSRPDAPPGDDLRGGRPIPPERKVDWSNFFGVSARPSKKINRLLAGPLIKLPDGVVDPTAPAERRSLATRNLRRSLTFALPSGQTVARYMCEEEIPDNEFWDGIEGASGPAPLWFYVLREAELRASGRHLGPVGARIVAEVFIGLLQADTASYLNHAPCWTPTLPGKNRHHFTMEDLLRIADGDIDHGCP